ncbi:hypothetical protein TRFO_24755 [Tritrichomonas foetus]|uniref:Uncharacterized protein n=1 Tax=Tritrichomonas foetus TaxID=1144522 RepID=A0A1J4KC43_9EUKA|nr:hypothetical protein TRFO_24755 [Tritrichomonas foetus]|eukprot:OHT07029.1 hypothetical protein TRFO_24755 [Tritrichomonas foetus]
MNETQENDDKCPYEQILMYDSHTGKYRVKLFEKKHADSIFLSEEEICSYVEGKTLFNRFLRHKTEFTDVRAYDPIYDKIDTILFQQDDKYLILWCGLGFDSLTWETEVDKKQLNLFLKREKVQYPLKNEDAHAPPLKKLDFVQNYGSLTPTEKMTLNKLISCYNGQRDFLLKENMGIESLNACISFLRILQNDAHEHGPYLIVSDNKRWYDRLRERSEMLPVCYNGNEPSCEKIRELYFQNDSNQINFHVLVISPEKLEHDIQYVSMINYRVAIFHCYNAQQIYKKYTSLDIGMNICIRVVDPTQSAQQLERLTSAFVTKENEELLSSDELRKSQEISNKLQPALQRKMKHGDPQFISPPIQTIDCPLSEIQKKICRSVLTQYSKSPQAAVEKVLRICSHSFLTSFGEYDLGSPDLIESSTKLKVLEEILNNCQQESKTTLIISQFQQMIEYIIDLCDMRDELYIELSTEYDQTDSSFIDIPSVYLYNPKNNKCLPPIENIQCVVIFDGRTGVWNDMMMKHRSSRTPLFNISNVYHLQCRDCCESELLNISESSSFNLKRAETILYTAAVHAFSDFEVPPPSTLLLQEKSDFSPDETNLMTHFIQHNDFSPELEGEIIQGIPPPELSDDEAPPHEWTIHERNLLARGLFRMGFNRWEAIQKTIGLYLPLKVMEKEAMSLIQYVLKASGSSTGYNVIRNYLKKIEEKGPIVKFDPDSIFSNENFLNDLQRKASTLLRRLEFLYYLDNSLGGDSNITPDKVPFYRFGGGNPTEWWTETHDKALAYISFKFGLGMFDHIEEYPDDTFCELFMRIPEFMEYKRLTERAMKLIDAAKKISMSDQKVVEILSNRSSKWPPETQSSIISNILKYGIFEDDQGNRDYDMLADQIQFPDLGGKEIGEYVEELLQQCNQPDSNNGISFTIAQRVIQRVKAMSQLRKLLRTKDRFKEKISKSTRWRSLPKKWNVDMEFLYFEKVEKQGFGNLQDIFQDSELSQIFESGIPSFLLTEEDVVKRINVIHDADEIIPIFNRRVSSTKGSGTSVSSSGSSSNSKKKKKAPSKPTGGIGKKLVVKALKELQRGVRYPYAVTQVSEILSIGTIVTDRPHFHSERYVYPAGYKATRQFADLKHPNNRVTWISEIIDNGGDAPVFRIYPQDDPDTYIEGETPSSPWVIALKTLSDIRGEKGKANTISGPEAFLLSHPSTIYLIQKLPGIKDCVNYVYRPIDGEDNNDEDKDD